MTPASVDVSHCQLDASRRRHGPATLTCTASPNATYVTLSPPHAPSTQRHARHQLQAAPASDVQQQALIARICKRAAAQGNGCAAQPRRLAGTRPYAAEQIITPSQPPSCRWTAGGTRSSSPPCRRSTPLQHARLSARAHKARRTPRMQRTVAAQVFVVAAAHAARVHHRRAAARLCDARNPGSPAAAEAACREPCPRSELRLRLLTTLV